ncbi:hypothetical protein HDU76_012078, partial [Blyttiomyces sp. JEL0837]
GGGGIGDSVGDLTGGVGVGHGGVADEDEVSGSSTGSLANLNKSGTGGGGVGTKKVAGKGAGNSGGGSGRPNAINTTDDMGPSSPGSRMSPYPGTQDSDLGAMLDDISKKLVSKAFPEPSTIPQYDAQMGMGMSRANAGSVGGDYDAVWAAANGIPWPPPSQHAVPTETFQILNDLVVDRGPSAFMSQLELFVDDKHLTTAQADGLVIATPTGSTAYSLSAGGSIVHPEVPSILVTPICPHTLSFRPMLLPDGIELKVQVPRDSRATAWASFDGRHRTELKQGDFITITMSRFPMPTICAEDQ